MELKTVEVPYFGITEWEMWEGDAFYTLQNVGLDYEEDWVEEYGLYIESFVAQIAVVEDGFVEEIYPKFWSSSAPSDPAIFSMKSNASFEETVGHLMYQYKLMVIDEKGVGRQMVDARMAGFKEGGK